MYKMTDSAIYHYIISKFYCISADILTKFVADIFTICLQQIWVFGLVNVYNYCFHKHNMYILHVITRL